MNDESLELTSQQSEVLEALKDKKTKKYPLSDWYLGALYTLNNHYNPDRISQAAHSLRELLEKLPRVIREMDAQGSSHDFKKMRRILHERFSRDKERYEGEWKGKKIDDDLDITLGKVDDYLERNQQPTRRERMQTAIEAFDPMVGQLVSRIREKKRDKLFELWKTLEGFTHHSSRPDIEKFKECLSTLERMVLDLLAPITSQDQHEIQLILKRSDRSESDVERMMSLIERRGANFAFFFQNATDASWIPALEKRGYFDQLPGIEPTDDGRMIFPSWWPILYLERVSVTDPCLVVDTILNFKNTDNPRIKNTDNPRILHEIVEIALKVEPVEQSLRLKDWVSKYLQSPYHLSDSDLIKKLIDRWGSASCKAVDAALNLIKIAISFRANPEFPLEPQSRFSEWEYLQILEKGVKPLAEREPYQTAQVLLDATATMFHKDDLEENRSNGSTFLRFKRVNELGGEPEPPDSLAHMLTFACEKVYERRPEDVSALDQALRRVLDRAGKDSTLQQRWDIFTRIRQHLYALHLNEQTKPWIREMILAHEDYNRWSHRFEFQRMIRLSCEKFGADLLPETEKERIFEAILSGPSEQNFRARMGARFTQELFEEWKRHFRRMQLNPFSSVLFGKYDEYFKELNAEAEKPIVDDDYEPYRLEGVKGKRIEERSPKPVEELEKMSDEEILSFLNEWGNVGHDSDEWWVHINFEGLTQTFQTLFKESIISDESRLHFWLENRNQLERPIYVKAIVSAIHEQVKLKQFDNLGQWFDLCEWVLSHPDQPKKEGVNRSDVSREHPSWQSSRQAVGDFVGMCLEEDINVPISGRQRLASLLDKLCTQYDRRLDEDEPVLLNRDDQLTEALNNTRSMALEHLVKFGYWIRRQLEDDQAATPEVFTILEKRLGSECEYALTLPEYAFLGRNYGRIYGLDREWAIRHKNDLLPQEKLPAWTEAFENFLRYNQPYKQIFDIVRDDIEFALENIDKFKTDSTDTLGKRLFTCYLWEFYPLTGDSGLLEKFYKKTKEDKGHWSRLFNHIGISLKNSGNQLEASLEQRIIDFFNWRFEKQEPSELKEFTFWLDAECLDAEWRLISLSKVLDINELKNRRIYKQISALREMVEDHTTLVVECFAKLTEIENENDGNFYIHIPTDKAKPILRAGLNSSDDTVRANAERARENLLRCGRFDFLDMEG